MVLLRPDSDSICLRHCVFLVPSLHLSAPACLSSHPASLPEFMKLFRNFTFYQYYSTVPDGAHPSPLYQHITHKQSVISLHHMSALTMFETSSFFYLKMVRINNPVFLESFLDM